MSNKAKKPDSADMRTHETFILADLLPLVVGHAKAEGHPTEMVALACFLSLSTILLRKGIPREALIKGIDASNTPALFPGDIEPSPERLVILSEPHFEQFDNLTLACMASNGTYFAHESLACTEPDDDVVWNAHVSMINSCCALGVLVQRLAGGGPLPSGREQPELFLPEGETLQ